MPILASQVGMSTEHDENVNADFNHSSEEDVCMNDASEEQNKTLTKAQRKRLKRKLAIAEKRAVKAKRPKTEDSEPPVSSNIVLPATKGFVSLLDTEEKRLAAARARLAEMYTHVLKIQPVPRPCPPGLLKDLCPLAVSIRIPTKKGAGYAFLQFRNQMEMQAAQKMLSEKSLGNKTLKVTVACSDVRPDVSDWHGPDAKMSSDFDWNTLFVTRLPRATTRLDLGQVFRKARDVRLTLFDDGSCKGTCTLKYKKPEDALRAFETRHGTFIRGSPIYVNFALKSKKPPSQARRMIPMEADASSPIKSNKANDDTTETAVEPSNSEEFVIDQKPGTKKLFKIKTPSLSKKLSKVATNSREDVHPKLLKKHQLKRKGTLSSKDSTMSALDALLRPPASKPKSAKKSKKLTKRGKPSKHR